MKHEMYKEVKIVPNYRMTSQAPGQGHSASPVDAGRVSTKTVCPVVSYPSIITRMTIQFDISRDCAEDLFQDMIKFMWMAAHTTEVRIPSAAIDEAWHVFILFTNEYNQFCRQYLGGYLHHEPHEASIEVGLEDLQPTIDDFVKTYEGKPSDNWDYVPFKTWTQQNSASA